MNNEHELLLFGLQDLAWDSKLVFHPFFLYLFIYWFLLNCSSVCYLCLEFLVVGGKVKQEEEVPGAKMSARQIGNTGITRQRHHPTIKDSEIKPHLFGTHHALYIPNDKDSFFYIVTILHPEIIQSIDRVIINFLKSHEVLWNYSFV